MKEIKGFRNQWDFLSNFSDSKIEYNSLTYFNAEEAFQAQKDLSRSNQFCGIGAGRAKKLGRGVNLRSDWEDVKEQIMYEVVLAKFVQNNDLRNLLVSTDDAYLEELNSWHDCIWGVCECPKCINKAKQNKLGKILMRVREELKE